MEESGFVVAGIEVEIDDGSCDLLAPDLELNLFPKAHFEIVLFGRYQKAAAGAMGDSSPATLGMLQLHYYL